MKKLFTTTKEPVPILEGFLRHTFAAENVAPLQLLSQEVDGITYVGVSADDIEDAKRVGAQLIDAGGGELADPTFGQQAHSVWTNFVESIRPQDETLQPA